MSGDVSTSVNARSFPQKTQNSEDRIWRTADETSLTARAESASPRTYQVVELDDKALSRVLGNAPMEFTEAAKASPPMISLPMPDGSFARFHFEESPCMEPELAAQFPEVKSYRAQGVDDTTATARFDWSPNGFNAIVLSSNGTVFIAPYTAGDTKNHMSFYKKALQEGFKPPQCEVTEAMQAAPSLMEGISTSASVGTSLRTYRLAIATTIEYTNNSTYGGNKASTLTKLNTIVNLINAIYEHEVSIRFQLVAGELSIIFDSGDDGLTNGNQGMMVNESTGVINGGLGSSGAYDVGHSLGLAPAGSSGGQAGIGVVCGATKGRGASNLGIALVTGNFAIDSGLVAHEWGHQYSAGHTFNSGSGNCGGNRSASTAWEPGSGSTVMSYAGTCSPENLQNNSDSYFVGGTFDQIVAYSNGSGACAVLTSTGNNPPTVSAGPDSTIPMGTPFTLTATASDPDGDALTYSWEEKDLGAASPPMSDDGSRPLFRTFLAVGSPSRIFPKLSDILNNTSTIGETLPTTTRAMNFRVTARDNRAAGGGVNSDAMILNVTTTSGPFVVTAPNTAVSWTGGTTQTVNWNVANTTSAPVSCANVKISLSTNGGTTFPIVLKASTPNDGSQVITVPNVASTATARVKVQGVGNVFFDVSNTNFSLVQGTSGGSRAAFDFDGDGKTDLGFYRSGLWGMLQSAQSLSFASGQFFSWGGGGLQPVVADFDGDGRADLAYMVPPAGGQSAAYAILKSTANYHFSQAQFVSAGFPSLGDTPVAGDFDGDGKADPGIWRASNGVWIIPRSSTNYSTFIFVQWGQAGDIPIVGDFDGDWKADIGFYRNGLWGVLMSGQGYSLGSARFFSWGGAGLQPVVADYDGDGKADIAYMVPPASGQSAAYAILKSTTNWDFTQAIFVAAGFPSLGDTPVVGDFDGDGKADPGIWRSSQGVWIVPLSSTNYATYLFSQWGQAGDVQMPISLTQY